MSVVCHVCRMTDVHVTSERAHIPDNPAILHRGGGGGESVADIGAGRQDNEGIFDDSIFNSN